MYPTPASPPLRNGRLARAFIRQGQGLGTASIQAWGLGVALGLALVLVAALVQTCQDSVTRGERLRALQRHGAVVPTVLDAGTRLATRRGQDQATPG